MKVSNEENNESDSELDEVTLEEIEDSETHFALLVKSYLKLGDCSKKNLNLYFMKQYAAQSLESGQKRFKKNSMSLKKIKRILVNKKDIPSYVK